MQNCRVKGRARDARSQSAAATSTRSSMRRRLEIWSNPATGCSTSPMNFGGCRRQTGDVVRRALDQRRDDRRRARSTAAQPARCRIEQVFACRFRRVCAVAAVAAIGQQRSDDLLKSTRCRRLSVRKRNRQSPTARPRDAFPVPRYHAGFDPSLFHLTMAICASSRS